MAIERKPRVLRWFEIAAKILAPCAFGGLLLLSVVSVPYLYECGGWLPIVACAIWPIAGFGAFGKLGHRLHIWRWSKLESLVFVALLMLAIWAPLPFWAWLRYDSEAAIGALTIVIVPPAILAIVVGAIRSRRNRPWREFLAQFENGPVGVWRAKYTFGDERDMEPGCEIVFAASGAGRFRRWEKATDEPSSAWQRFQWRFIEERLIEVRMDGAESPPQALVFDLAQWDNLPPTARLVLKQKEWWDRLVEIVMEREEVTESVDLDESGWWPGNFFFAYQSPPTGDQ